MVSPKKSALLYLERGWAVLPLHRVDQDCLCSCSSPKCQSAGKHPLLPHGLKDASRDISDVRVWWNRWPHANVGVVTGHASGFWVLDIDPRNGGDDSLADLILEHGGLPPTLTALTGGGGRHFLFAMPEGPLNCGKLTEGIDIKGDGGYIVTSPSNHASGGVYRWQDPDAEILPAPDWLMNMPKQVASPLKSLGPEAKELNPQKVEEIRSALLVIPADDRDEWLYIGMALHSAIPEIGDASAFSLWSEWSKKSGKYDPADQGRVWSSFDDGGGVSLSTLFAIAKKYGFNPSAVMAPPVSDLKQISEVELVDLEEQGVVEMPDLLLHPHGVLHEIVDWIDSTSIRPQRPFAVASALTLLGTVLGRKYATESGLRTNLYMISVGPTGCGKNHARTATKRILSAAGLSERLGGEELASGQAIMSRVGLSPVVLFQLDEFGLLMSAIQNPNAGSHLVSILSNLMKLFSSAGDTYIGTEYADQEKRPRLEVICPCVSVYGTTTPETFYKSLGSSHVVSGYLNRLLVVETSINRPKRQKPISSDVPEPILQWIAKATKAVGSGGNLEGLDPTSPVTVPMSTGAEDLFDSFDAEIDRAMDKDRGTGLDALHNRAWEHGAKLALILALSRDLVRPVITVQDAEWAITFVKWSLSRLIHEVESRVADSPFQAKAKECLLTLVKAGERGLTERDMGRVSSWARLTPREREAVLSSLQIAGQVAKVEMPTKGRPRQAWVAIK